MTHTPLTKAERDKIVARRNQLLGDGAAVEWYDFGDLPYQGERNLAMKGVDWKLAALSVNALPRLLANLDAAEAERSKLRDVIGVDISLHGGLSWVVESIERIKAQRDRAESELDAERKMRVEADSDAWVALGKPGGTYDTTNVQRLCEQFAVLKADRDAALIHLPACCGSLADAADTLRQERDELAAERDALKARLSAAESSHSELFLSGQVAELRGKLAALVEAVSDVCSRGMPGGDSDSAITIYKVEALLRAAIAAAR